MHKAGEEGAFCGCRAGPPCGQSGRDFVSGFLVQTDPEDRAPGLCAGPARMGICHHVSFGLVMRNG